MPQEFLVAERSDWPRVLLIPDPAESAESPLPEAGKGTLRRYRRIGAVLAVTDFICLAVALLAAHLLRFGSFPKPEYLAGMLVAGVLWVGVFHALGLYAPYDLSRFEEFRRTISAVGIGLVVIILLTFWLEVYLSRSWMAITLIIGLLLEVVARTVARTIVSRLRAHGSLVLRTLIVGRERHAAELMKALDVSGSAFLPLGCIDVTSPFLASGSMDPAIQVASLRQVFREYEAECVFVTAPSVEPSHLRIVMRAARQEGVVMRVFAQFPGILPSRVNMNPVGRKGIALTLMPSRLSPFQRAVKRGMDLLLASVGLIVLSPGLCFVAIAIRCSSRGPALFRQERVTEGGRHFRMLKFRTMTDGSRREVHEQAIDTSLPYFKIKDDPRVTAVGRFLRRWSIDEFPQLLNVVVGDMSLVGPRPLPSDQVAANLELLGPRHEVRAGITGWWQIHGRSDTDDPEGAIAKDDFYIENWSPMLDLYILLRTIGAVASRRGAY
jgi:exopolysaccharide biosynthesis polyprenyl glycosylphosphotransferase